MYLAIISILSFELQGIATARSFEPDWVLVNENYS